MRWSLGHWTRQHHDQQNAKHQAQVSRSLKPWYVTVTQQRKKQVREIAAVTEAGFLISEATKASCRLRSAATTLYT